MPGTSVVTRIANAARAIFKSPLTMTQPYSMFNGPWWFGVRDIFTGAWQRNIEIDAPQTLLQFPSVYACVTLISGDMSKCPPRHLRKQPDKTWQVVEDSSTAKLLLRPNHYQHIIKFVECWILSLLLRGNTYVLKRRDLQGNIVALYILDSYRVQVKVAEDGSVWYVVRTDNLSLVTAENDSVAIPASEIIHDLISPLYHPLCGVSPLYAAGMPATAGNKIQANAVGFFGNAARPSGILTAPTAIDELTALEMKTRWTENFTGTNSGRVAILSDGVTYTPLTMNASDSQAAEQLNASVDLVAQAFHMPLWKLGRQTLPATDVEALNQIYYSDCLQALFENMEACLDAGLEMAGNEMIEMDLDRLFRMSSSLRYDRHSKAIKGGWLAPNEARVLENYAPVDGGEFPFMQQQNWQLGQLADREAIPDAPSVAPPPASDDEKEDEEKYSFPFKMARIPAHLQSEFSEFNSKVVKELTGDEQ